MVHVADVYSSTSLHHSCLYSMTQTQTNIGVIVVPNVYVEHLPLTVCTPQRTHAAWRDLGEVLANDVICVVGVVIHRIQLLAPSNSAVLT
jgi:hypothetical protein